MKKYLILLILSICFIKYSVGQTMNVEWKKDFGEYLWILSSAQDSYGSFYFTGRLDGEVDFDPGPNQFKLIGDGGINDIFISKLDSIGNFSWAMQFVNINSDPNLAINIDKNNNVYVIGEYTKKMIVETIDGIVVLPEAQYNPRNFLLKLDINGNVLFAKSCSYPYFTSINFDNNNNLILTGPSLIEKYNSKGTLIWSKIITGISSDIQNATVDKEDNIYIVGAFSNSINFDTDTSTKELSTIQTKNAYIVKLDSSGKYVWSKAIGSIDSEDKFTKVACDKDGKLYIIGYYTNPIDIDPGAGKSMLSAGPSNYILNLNSNGDFIWGHDLLSVSNFSGIDEIISLVCNKNGVFLYGRFNGTVDFDFSTSTFNLTAAPIYKDVFILKMNDKNEFVKAIQYGDSKISDNSVFPYTIFIDDKENIYLSGEYSYNNFFCKLSSSFSNSIHEQTNKQLELIVYPNPTKNIISIELTSNDKKVVSILNATGIEVETFTITGNKVEKDLSNYSPGLYLLRVNDQTQVTKKIIIE